MYRFLARPVEFLLILLLCLAAANPGRAQDDGVLRAVKLEPLTATQSVREREFFGQVVARQTLDLAFQVGGQVNELIGVEGSRLSQGDLIAKLDLEPFELNLRQARLELEQAERFLERQRQLGADTVSQVTIDDAETAANLARVSLRNAELDLQHATLTAPFDALVARRFVANYTTIEAGTPVVRLHDMSELRIEIEVPEVLFRSADSGADLEISAYLPETGARYPVEIREYQAETSAIGQTYTVTLSLPELNNESIIPGASITVTARLNSGDSKIVLPPEAIVVGPDRQTYVMGFEPEEGQAEGDDRTGRAVRIPVEIEADENGNVVMIDGPEAGTEIVVAGANRVSDGERVRRFTRIGN